MATPSTSQRTDVESRGNPAERIASDSVGNAPGCLEANPATGAEEEGEESGVEEGEYSGVDETDTCKWSHIRCSDQTRKYLVGSSYVEGTDKANTPVHSA